MKRLVLLATLVPMLSSAQAQSVPQTIGYQGRLLKSDGTPMNIKVSVTFRIYEQAVGDTNLALWAETQDVTPNSGGFYAVFLGAVTQFKDPKIFNGGDRWLGLAIGSDNELIPRQKIASVAYSMRAGHAVTADNATNAANVIGGTVSASSISSGSISTSNLTVTGGPLQVSSGKVTVTVPMAYVAVGSCPPGDAPFLYRTAPTTCSDSSDSKCGSCTTAYHGWSTNSGQENCSYAVESCPSNPDRSCICSGRATCNATRYVLCNP